MKFKFTFILLLASIFTIQAQWIQEGENVEGENPEDRLGNSTSMSSNGLIFAAGASTNDGNGENSGHVRVYENIDGVWQQMGEDIDGETGGDIFGISSELNASGTRIVIGASMTGTGGDGSGYAKVYEYDNGEWLQLGSTIHGTGSFGYTISISADGTTVAVGAMRNDINGFFSGQARVFKFINNEWIQLGQDLNGEESNNYFGRSVAINDNGTILAVGANRYDGNNNNDGRVRVYELIDEVWTQVGQDIVGESENDHSGQSVRLNNSGTIVAIGADGNSENGYESGQVRVFKINNDVWTQIGQDIDGSSEGDRLGWDIDLNGEGNFLIVGAPSSDDLFMNAGKALVFENQNNTWVQIGDILNGNNEGDSYGESVCINDLGDKIAVSGSNDLNNSTAGYISFYRNENLSVSDFNQSSFSLYPNPTNNIVNFCFTNNIGQKITLLDVTGKVLLEKEVKRQNEILNISHLESGIYLVNILFDEKIVTSKVIKN